MAMLLAVFLAPATAADPPPALDPRAIAVIERTATTRQTYAVYTRIVLHLPSDKRTFVTAEFHEGDKHRVDTPDMRMVADCKGGAGFRWLATTGEVRAEANAAASACGIDRTARLIWARYLGQATGSFGKVDRIELVDASNRRTYEVTAAGVILGQTIAPAAAGAPPLLELTTIALEKTLPPGDIFAPERLSASAIPQNKARAGGM